MNLYDAIGLVGVAAFLAPFILVQLHKLDADSLSYSILNLIGSVSILISMVSAFNLASFVSNIIWTVFSLVGIICILMNRSTAANRGLAPLSNE